MNQEIYVKNRKNLVEKMADSSILVMFAGRAPYKTADEIYPFTPNRNFYYLTGIDVENIILMITKNGDTINEMLFIEKNDPELARWVGEKISEDKVKELSGVEKIDCVEKFNDTFGSLFAKNNYKNVYLDLEKHEWGIPASYSINFANEIRSKYPAIIINDAYHFISEFRTIKNQAEIENIKTAIGVTNKGILAAMKNARPGMMEYEIEAFFDFTLISNGVRDKAFKTIGASGKNATILHYSENNCKTKDGDLMLLDLGALHNYYSADITRTFPVNGKFTERQKEIYNIVLKTMKLVEASAKPGISIVQINEIAKKSLAEGCIELGLIKEESDITKYYFHGVSHYLGADTHDVGSREVPFEPGMVITNEPGLYIPEENIGIRIEDDLLITEDGCLNLSKEIIKEVEEIEAYIAENRK